MTAHGLTSKQLVQRALAGQPVHRVPTGPLAVHYCARIAGISIRRYTTDARALADAVVRYYERFRPDAVWLSADTWVSAEAMGATVGADSDDQPFGGVGQPLVRTAADVDRIPPPDVGSSGRYPLMLEALQRIVSALGRDVFVVACFDQYPFSLACELIGLEQVMLKLAEDRPLVEAVMERCLEYVVAYGKALAEVGADLLSGGDSPAGLVGPEYYREAAWPYEKRLVSELKAATGKPVSLHICGNAVPYLPGMAETGADVLEVDAQVDLAEAARIVGPQVTLWGNLDPVGVLAQGTCEQVRQAARAAVRAVAAANHRRFVLSSGCTLAMETPPENVDALLEVQQWPDERSEC